MRSILACSIATDVAGHVPTLRNHLAHRIIAPSCVNPRVSATTLRWIHVPLKTPVLQEATCHHCCGTSAVARKWTSECDRKLHRLVCYINSSKHLRMIGWVGDDLSALQPHLFADADFAGCTSTQRSTSGYRFAIRGPNTCFPITGVTGIFHNKIFQYKIFRVSIWKK